MPTSKALMPRPICEGMAVSLANAKFGRKAACIWPCVVATRTRLMHCVTLFAAIARAGMTMTSRQVIKSYRCSRFLRNAKYTRGVAPPAVAIRAAVHAVLLVSMHAFPCDHCEDVAVSACTTLLIRLALLPVCLGVIT